MRNVLRTDSLPASDSGDSAEGWHHADASRWFWWVPPSGVKPNGFTVARDYGGSG
jgi:hypothetical protein